MYMAYARINDIYVGITVGSMAFLSSKPSKPTFRGVVGSSVFI